MMTSSRLILLFDILITLGLTSSQILVSAYTIFIHRVLSLGVHTLSIVIYGGLSTVIFILPFAALETAAWKSVTFTPKVLLQNLFIGLFNVSFQFLSLAGVKMTSPAMASAIPNLLPAIIFTISAIVKLEKFSIWSYQTRLKVAGTILCMGGAIAVSFLMSPISSLTLDGQYVLGCFYLFIAYFSFSCSIVLQAIVMIVFPAPFSISAMSWLIESVAMAVIKFAIDKRFDFGGDGITSLDVIGILALPGVVGVICLGYSTWCIRKKGPVFVTIFTPVQTVSSAILSMYIFGQTMSFGCLVGMLFMFIGLYAVLLAKWKEGYEVDKVEDSNLDIADITNPLLPC